MLLATQTRAQLHPRAQRTSSAFSRYFFLSTKTNTKTQNLRIFQCIHADKMHQPTLTNPSNTNKKHRSSESHLTDSAGRPRNWNIQFEKHCFRRSRCFY
jgi:hypothetical protein